MYKLLKDVANYSSERIDVESITVANYVTTDNLLQNKQGKVRAEKLPSIKGNTTKYEPGDILIANIRPYLKKIWFADTSGGSSADVLTLKVKPGYNPKFVFYSLFRDDFFTHVMNGSKGTKMPRGDKRQIMEFLIPNLQRTSQDKIAKVLSDLDAKIELNNKINCELEGMAKLIYDYWFVQFDFPISESQAAAMDRPELAGKPYKSSGGKMVFNEQLKREVPEGWEDGKLGDLGEIIGGSTPSRGRKDYFDLTGIAWITPKDLSDNKGNKFISKGELSVSELGLKSASLRIMPKGTILLSTRAPIGYLAIALNDVTTNQGFKSFVPNDSFSTPFIYYTIQNSIKTIEQYASGSTFKEISTSVLRSINALLPSQDVIKRYTETVNSIFKRQEICEIENHALSELRDWLLPMLMNGQVRVVGEEEDLRVAAEPGIAYKPQRL